MDIYYLIHLTITFFESKISFILVIIMDLHFFLVDEVKIHSTNKLKRNYYGY